MVLMPTASSLLAALSFGALLVAGCSSSLGSYQCERDGDCLSEGKAGATCESNQFCSFSDSECGPEGQRYGESSGEFSNQCVGQSDQADAGPFSGVDAAPGQVDAALGQVDAAPMATCMAAPVTLNAVDVTLYTLPENCTSLTIEAFGAGGGGSERGTEVDSGSGGGAGSGAQIGFGPGSMVLIAAAGGGGGSSDDTTNSGVVLGGGGGGGGYAVATFALAPGTEVIVVVGEGGKTNDDTAVNIGASGGEPGGGAGGGPLEDGGDATVSWGGGGGAGDDGTGGGAVYGGGGGCEEEGDGGDSTYGGAGAGTLNGGANCGQTSSGGTCNGANGGGGGFFVHALGQNMSGSLGSAGMDEDGGAAAQNGPGKGGTGALAATNGGNGRVTLTPRD